MTNTAEDKIKDVIKRYTEGTYEGDSQKLQGCFHSEARMNGYLGGQLLLATPAPFIADMEANKIKDAENNYGYEIDNLEIADRVASVTLRETGFPGGAQFVNFFHLLESDGEWKITSKVFLGG